MSSGRGSLLARGARLLRHPVVQIGVGLVLVATGLVEVFEGLEADLEGMRPGTEHGVVLFGFYTSIKAVAEMLERGAELEVAIEEARELRREEA